MSCLDYGASLKLGKTTPSLLLDLSSTTICIYSIELVSSSNFFNRAQMYKFLFKFFLAQVSTNPL